VFEIAAVSAAATVLLAGRAVREEIRRALTGSRNPDGSWHAALLGHGLAALGFYELTVAGLEYGVAASPRGDIWFCAWATVLLLTVTLWALAVLPLRFWLGWARRGWRVSLGGVLLGSATLYVGFQLQRLEALNAILFTAAASVLRALGYETVLNREQELLGTPAFAISLGGPCRGYEGVVLVVAFAAVYLWAYRRRLRFPAALLVVPLGAVLSYTFNIARIVVLIVLGTWRGEMAVEGFHSVAGWFSFGAVALGVVAASQRWWSTAPPRVRSSASPTINPAAFYLLPLLATVTTAMLTRIFARDADSLYPMRVLAAATVLWVYRDRLIGLRWRGCGWAVVAGVVTFVMWVVLGTSGTRDVVDPPGPAGLSATEAVLWLGVRFLGYVLIVPLAEELAFRGYLMRKLIAADFETVPLGQFSWLSWLGSSLLFGALHGHWLAGTLAGLIFATTLSRRRELADPIVAHMTVNGCLLASALVTGRWALVS